MQERLLKTHNRMNLDFTHGEGVFLCTKEGKKFLDLSAGGAVNCLGYGNRNLQRTLAEQAAKVWHISNYYLNSKGEELASHLCAKTGLDKAFFCNSGTEAVEAALKITRKFFHAQNPQRYEVIAMENAFHGRTMGSLSASFNPKHRDGYAPFLEGFLFAKPNIADISATITPKTCAIILEPIQGEGGINFLGWELMQQIRELCDKTGIIMIVDEVQTGYGRTGRFLACEWAGITPDILCLAKGIGAGFPLGCTMVKNRFAEVITPGAHGTTYGGNQLAMAVGLEVIAQISDDNLLAEVRQNSKLLLQELEGLKAEFPDIIKEIKGFGMMLGLEIDPQYNTAEIMQRVAENGALVGLASNNVIRLTPPLIINSEEISLGARIIKTTIAQL